ncbi:MAG: molecular chaperone DnaJ [Halobacteriaceae archaeon]
MSENFYDVLGVSRDADEDEIQQAFRKKAAKYHPDVSDDPDAEEKFKKIKKAKEVLTDEEKRRMYDQLGHEQFEQAEKRGGFDEGGRQRGARSQQGNPFGNMGNMGGGMEDIFEQFFGSSGSRQRPQSGRDIRTELTIDLDEAYHGADKKFTIRRPEQCDECNGNGYPPNADVRTCPECNGRGQITQTQQTPLGRVQQTTTCPRCDGEGDIYSETCHQCGGDGTVNREATLSVTVPAGIRDGQTLQMDGEGEPGEGNAPAGDLLIDVNIRDHDKFDREGDDLYRREPISFPQAVFGDSIQIDTFEGTIEMDIPGGTQSGETFRLQGKGMPRLRGRGYGDLYIKTQVVTPESLNQEQKEALEKFAEAGGEEISVDEGFFERIKNSF